MKQPPVDIVYVLGTGSPWNNNEIKFSIRSVRKNLKNAGQIFIVGEAPFGLEGIIPIQHPDEFPATNADGNIIRKVLRACIDPRVSEKFLFMNDDHIFMQPMRADQVPPYHKGDMKTYPDEYWTVNPWRHRLLATAKVLQNAGLPTLHFDCHTPILFEKEKFIEALNRFDYASGIGLCMKSLYGNTWYPSAPQLEGQKKTVFTWYKLRELEERFLGTPFLSFNDQGLNDALKIFLYQHFRDPSPYETEPLEDRIIDIYVAARESCSYQGGLDTYLKHFKNENLKGLFLADRNQRFENKINYLLEQKLADL